MNNLPCIVDIAEEYGLELNTKTLNNKEVMAKCPFCHGDSGRRGKYKLSLNQVKKVFKCWICKNAGGVLQFEALLSGQSFAEVKKKYFGQRKRSYHPAEMLSPKQLSAIEWQKAKQESYDHFRNHLATVYQDWNTHCYRNKRLALAKLLVANATGKYNEVIGNIQKQEETSYVSDLTQIVLEAFSSKQWTEQWMVESLQLAVSSLRTSFDSGEMDGNNALVYLLFLEQNVDIPVMDNTTTLHKEEESERKQQAEPVLA
ncbi:CHC2 zinc finger domain-containing protein [Bacillus piscicola]|uniref:CHC2 zinc finger domain-containing protein n=1 Tax=Bacillus piscicola TaxID=1632684 RepID=UPI001F098842|nr:CHC2 zinc finger domain-containing protein [Bacillus piscicola]